VKNAVLGLSAWSYTGLLLRWGKRDQLMKQCMRKVPFFYADICQVLK